MIKFQIIRPNNGMHTDRDSAGAPSPPVMPVGMRSENEDPEDLHAAKGVV